MPIVVGGEWLKQAAQVTSPELVRLDGEIKTLKETLAALPRPAGAGTSPSNGYHSGIDLRPEHGIKVTTTHDEQPRKRCLCRACKRTEQRGRARTIGMTPVMNGRLGGADRRCSGTAPSFHEYSDLSRPTLFWKSRVVTAAGPSFSTICPTA